MRRHTLEKAIAEARRAGSLGADVAGSGKAFDMEARLGAGAYICGEETSLLDSLEGKRGQVRAKPPLPALKGLFGKPTVINNVLSFAATPWILAHGANAYADYGLGRSKGTQPFQLAGNIRRGGLVATGLKLAPLTPLINATPAPSRPLDYPRAKRISRSTLILPQNGAPSSRNGPTTMGRRSPVGGSMAAMPTSTSTKRLPPNMPQRSSMAIPGRL